MTSVFALAVVVALGTLSPPWINAMHKLLTECDLRHVYTSYRMFMFLSNLWQLHTPVSHLRIEHTHTQPEVLMYMCYQIGTYILRYVFSFSTL